MFVLFVFQVVSHTKLNRELANLTNFLGTAYLYVYLGMYSS